MNPTRAAGGGVSHRVTEVGRRLPASQATLVVTPISADLVGLRPDFTQGGVAGADLIPGQGRTAADLAETVCCTAVIALLAVAGAVALAAARFLFGG